MKMRPLALAAPLALLTALSPADPTRAAPTNLAPAGTSTGSSEGFGTVFRDANDGDRNGDYALGSVWHTTDPDATFPSFYQVDLGGSFYLDRVQVFPRTDARQGTVENFRISVFADDGAGAPGAQVFTGTYLPENPPGTSVRADFAWGTTDPGTVVPGGTLGRFVRLERLDNNPTFLTFAEMEVYGQPAPLGTNVALNRPATASPPGFGAGIGDGNDGDIEGDFFNPGFPVYHSEASGVGQFWQVDLGATTDLDYLQLFDRGDAETTTQFRVAVLDANAAEVFSTVVDSQGPLAYDHTIDLTDVAGQFVRVETTRGEFLAFSELRAVAVVPEPAAGALLLALGTAAVLRRRRRW